MVKLGETIKGEDSMKRKAKGNNFTGFTSREQAEKVEKRCREKIKQRKSAFSSKNFHKNSDFDMDLGSFFSFQPFMFL